MTTIPGFVPVKKIIPGWENEITIGGHLGQPPRIFETPAGMKITQLNIGHNRTNRKTGIKTTTWVIAKFFNSSAAEALQKGDNVTIKGRLEQIDWVDKETGAKRSKFEIIGDSLTKHPRGEASKLQTHAELEDHKEKVPEFNEFDVPF